MQVKGGRSNPGGWTQGLMQGKTECAGPPNMNE